MVQIKKETTNVLEFKIDNIVNFVCLRKTRMPFCPRLAITHGSKKHLRLKIQLEHDLNETLTLNNLGLGLEKKTLWSSYTLDNCINYFFHCNQYDSYVSITEYLESQTMYFR